MCQKKPTLRDAGATFCLGAKADVPREEHHTARKRLTERSLIRARIRILNR